MNTSTITKRLEKYSWRIGVFLTINITAIIAIAAASKVLHDLHPMVKDFINYTFTGGMLLMVFSFCLALLAWAWNRLPAYWQRVAGE